MEHTSHHFISCFIGHLYDNFTFKFGYLFDQQTKCKYYHFSFWFNKNQEKKQQQQKNSIPRE